MSILIDRNKKVIVQGITGREGMTRTKLMLDYGTTVLGGVTPGRGGQEVHGLSVFDTVREAVDNLGKIDVSVIFVPAPLVKDAALEAFDAGITLAVLVPDRVPIYDVLEIHYDAREKGAEFVGPNTLGLLSPGKAVLGMMGGRAKSAQEWFKPGNVGVTSRSGGMTSSLAYYLSKSGIGLSTIIHVGGDALVGLPHPAVVKKFQEDPETDVIVIFGEIGTSQEEMVAELIANGTVTKPVVAYIGGRAAQKGTRFSHAGAIIEGNRGTYEGKVSQLREAGAHVVEEFQEIPSATLDVLRNLSAKN
ncbi:MAG: succinate--CoA ligase subunit alpha [Calditrichaeota bacterium]|nr:succinate--CoA ligase subunit alpha [Calditrichota bacterium]RQV98590.1 MAG: succinate--CoA ligase subunit alpha [Calditrichota bacterium]